ncbi:metal ABC transporter permease [Dietzia aerolata]|uniref:metal ABC transporter permease n=1 Tax=Dietzia aerolata TaxID=595984 RepID=UPI00363EAAD9
MIDLLVEPMTYAFMRRALLVVAASGIAGALLSCWLVHMGWSLMGDAVSHAVLPGVVIAAMTGIPFSVGALIAALVAVALIGGVREAGTVREDAAMGIVFTALFSLGLVLIARFPSQQDLHSILFGSVLGVRDSDLAQVLIVAAFTVVVLLAFRRDLIMVAFDRVQAHALGLRTRALLALLLATLATATVAGVQSVGVILVVATLIIPGATAQLLARTMTGTMVLAVVVALAGGVTGLYFGYYADLPPGPVVVLTQAVLFLVVQLFAPRRGSYRGRWRPPVLDDRG